MTRDEIFAAIEDERKRQDAKWPRNLGENPHRAQYRFYAPHIILLEEKTGRLRGIWYESEREQLRDEFIKIATIAVRALEEVQ